MIRVCTTSNLGFGGAKYGFEICVLMKRSARNEVLFYYYNYGSRCRHPWGGQSIFGSRNSYIPFNWKSPVFFRKQLKKLLIESEITHLHNHQDWVAGWHWLAIIGLNVKKISHLHNSLLSIQNYTDNYSRPGRVAYYILGSIFQCFFSDDIFSTSAGVLKQYGLMKRLNPRLKPKVMYCGIPMVQ